MAKSNQPSLFDDPLPPSPPERSLAERIAEGHAEYHAKTRAHAKFVAWFLDCPNWLCAQGHTNFGRNKSCPGCGQPRPANYLENSYPG